MDEEIRKAIELTGAALAGNHSATTQSMLAAAMLEVASHKAQSGVGARDAWLRPLRLLGETCISLARQQERK